MSEPASSEQPATGATSGPPDTYAAPGAYPPPGTPLTYTSRPTNIFAVTSIAAGVCGLTVVPFFGALTAIVTGHVARSQIRRTGENGAGLATAGLWLGYVGIVLVVAAAVLLISFAATVGTTTDSLPAGTATVPLVAG